MKKKYNEPSELFQALKLQALRRCMESKNRYMDELAEVINNHFLVNDYLDNAEFNEFWGDYHVYIDKMREAGIK